MYHIIRITEKYSEAFAIEADSPEKAKRIAEKLYDKGIISANADLSRKLEYEDKSVETLVEAVAASDKVLQEYDIRKMRI